MGEIARKLPYRRAVVVGVHLGLVAAAYWLAFLLRFDFRLSAAESNRFLYTLPLLLLARGVAFAWFHLYEGLWRYVSMGDFFAILKAVSASSLFFVAGVLVLFNQGFPRSVFLLDWVLCLVPVGGVRLAMRGLRESSLKYRRRPGRRTLIVGAGRAAGRDPGDGRRGPPADRA